jgi:hypothetical protein
MSRLATAGDPAPAGPNRWRIPHLLTAAVPAFIRTPDASRPGKLGVVAARGRFSRGRRQFYGTITCPSLVHGMSMVDRGLPGRFSVLRMLILVGPPSGPFDAGPGLEPVEVRGGRGGEHADPGALDGADGGGQQLAMGFEVAVGEREVDRAIVVPRHYWPRSGGGRGSRARRDCSPASRRCPRHRASRPARVGGGCWRR